MDVLVFSWLAFGSYISSSSVRFFLPYTLQIAKAIPPSKTAPPTPPTTPPIVFLDELLKPELLPPLPFSRPAVVVAAAMTSLLVREIVTGTPLLVVTKIVVIAFVVLDVEKESVSVATALVISEVAITDPAEFVSLAVDVERTTVVESGVFEGVTVT